MYHGRWKIYEVEGFFECGARRGSELIGIKPGNVPVFNGVNQAKRSGRIGGLAYAPLHNHVIPPGGVYLPDFQGAGSVSVQGVSVASQKLRLGFIDLGKAGQATPVANSLGAEIPNGGPVAPLEVGVEGFGQPQVVGLPPLQVGGCSQLAGPQQPGQSGGEQPRLSQRNQAWGGPNFSG